MRENGWLVGRFFVAGRTALTQQDQPALLWSSIKLKSVQLNQCGRVEQEQPAGCKVMRQEVIAAANQESSVTKHSTMYRASIGRGLDLLTG